QIYEQLSEAKPDDVSLLYQLASLHILNEEVEKTIDIYARIEALHPGDLKMKKKLALRFKDEDIESLEKLATAEGDHARIYYYLGELYEKQKNREKAILNYRKATESGQSEPAPYLKLSYLLMSENPQLAIDVLEGGLKKLEGNAQLTEMLAIIYLKQENYGEAIKWFKQADRAIAYNPRDTGKSDFYFYFAIAAQYADELDLTTQELIRAINLNPGVLDAYFQFSFQEESEERKRQSIDVLRRLNREHRENAFTWMYIAFLYSQMKDHENAMEGFAEAEALVPEGASAEGGLPGTFYFWYGASCEQTGRMKKAEELFHRCIELNPQYGEAYNYLAYMWAEKGMKLDQALEYVLKALDLEPENGAFIDTLGWIYYMQGKHEEALVQIRKALQIYPDDQTINDHMGDIKDKLGKPDEANKFWKRSFIIDPENDKVAAKLTARGIDLAPLREEAVEWKKDQERKKAEEEGKELQKEEKPESLFDPAEQLL
ncbi:MAG: tetratricopeptide repeat protein, partial [Verrucomicrobiota bacterium]